MLSENEKTARKKFFIETGKTPEQETNDTAAVFVYAASACLVALGICALFYWCY